MLLNGVLLAAWFFVLVYSRYFSANPKSSLTFVASCLRIFVDIFVFLFSLTHLLSFPFAIQCKLIIFTMGKEIQLYLSQILRSTERGQGGKLGWSESSFLAPLKLEPTSKGVSTWGQLHRWFPNLCTSFLFLLLSPQVVRTNLAIWVKHVCAVF